MYLIDQRRLVNCLSADAHENDEISSLNYHINDERCDKLSSATIMIGASPSFL